MTRIFTPKARSQARRASSGVALFAKRFVLALTLMVWQLTLLPIHARAETFAAGACSLIPNSKTCVDTSPCKPDTNGVPVCLAGVVPPLGGLNVAQACWQYAYQYACASSTTNTCTAYEHNAACGLVASSCQNVAQPSGICDAWNYTYRCQTAPAVTTPQVTCTNGLFDTSQFPTPSNPNNTFATAAVAQEILRETQVYSNRGTEIFAGVKETCRKGYGGIQNCCKSAPGAKNNSQMASIAMGAAAQVVKYYGAQAIDWASSYVFDAMYNNGLWTDAMTSAFATGADTFGTSLAASSFSVGAYGVTYSTATYAAGTGATGTGLFSADTVLLNFSGNGVLLFNPYVFVAVVIIAVITSLVACNQDEQMLAMHKGANLSVYESTECTSSFFGSCLVHTDTYCSFNSVLAKIVNTQGKPQLGLDVTDCTGFTIAQISRLDFSHIDFSEFTQSIVAQAQNGLPTSSAINQAYQPVLQNVTGGSAQTGTFTSTSSIVGHGAAASAPPPNSNLPTYPPGP